MTSRNGSSREMRRSPPVPQRRRFAATVRSLIGLRKSPQGSHPARGMTETSANSRSAPLGRSPPRSVCTSRMISPRFSKPVFSKQAKVVVERSGVEAIIRWPPGTSLRNCQAREASKEIVELLPVLLAQHRESRQGGARDAVERRRNAPYAAAALPAISHGSSLGTRSGRRAGPSRCRAGCRREAGSSKRARPREQEQCRYRAPQRCSRRFA